jgi:predicted nucleotidyltransferase
MVSPLSASEMSLMRNNLRHRILEKERKLAERYQSAKHDAGKIIHHIAEHYHPSRIYQWGSLVSGSHFSEMSDIDIGIEGIQDSAVFFSIIADAEKMTAFPLDIVQMETIDPLFAKGIRKKGYCVYEHNRPAERRD